MNGSTLLKIMTLFGSLSLVSLGGGNAVLPAIHQQAVNAQHWLTDQQFADLFALSQAAPGPSSLFVSLIGLKAAGIPGALVALTAMLLPSSLLMLVVTHAWERFHEAKWRIAIERGLGPITVGLLFATGLTVIRASDHGLVAYVITGVTTVVLVWTNISPVYIIVAAAILGWLGWVP